MKNLKLSLQTILIALFLLTFADQNVSAAKNVPDFTARDINGKMLTMKEILVKGPVIVYFWNTCCGLKKDQIEALKGFNTTFGPKGLAILAVSEDGVGKAPKVKQTSTSCGMPFTVIIDNNREIKEKFNAFAEPSLFIIAKDGSIVASYAGYIPGDEKKVLKDLESLFGQYQPVK
jgi:peroxiredoxin